ncbi:MAG: Trp biosynthesis-associated membrane protein [Haloechinothrix sp.]
MTGPTMGKGTEQNPVPERAVPGRRPLWMVVVSLLLGAAAVWGSSRLTWTRTVSDAGVRGMVEVTETGAQRVPALLPLALLALAGIAGMVATGGWARRALSVLVALAGVAVCVAGVGGLIEGPEPRPGHGLALLGGLLVIAGGVVGIGAARTMPRLGARYENPQSSRPPTDVDDDLWKALSEGDDPTTR